VECYRDGAPVPRFYSRVLVIDGSTTDVIDDTSPWAWAKRPGKPRFWIDPTKSPKEWDAEALFPSKRTTIITKSAYAIEGDRLYIATHTENPTRRPKIVILATTRENGSGISVKVYERVKE
jgi:hypothetical protein